MAKNIMTLTKTDSSSLCVKDIADHCNHYKGADTKRSIFQLTTTLAFFILTCAIMFYSPSFWLKALLVLPAAGLLTRIFIFQHDCGHGSFFQSATANKWTGRFLSLLTVTPYDFWRRAHNMHHATAGDLNRRSVGGIDTITVREYEALTPKDKFLYRIYRNPFILLILGTPFYVIVLQRFPIEHALRFHDCYKTLSVSAIWKSIMLSNLSLAAFYGSLVFLLGSYTLLTICLPILVVTSWIGGWLFYIQHQFEDTYWHETEDWDRAEAALLGSSYYAMPKILQWFTGNIGLHHIHHLCSMIPNYKLQPCMDARPELAEINKMTLRESLQCLSLKLWDEKQQKLVAF